MRAEPQEPVENKVAARGAGDSLSMISDLQHLSYRRAKAKGFVYMSGQTRASIRVASYLGWIIALEGATAAFVVLLMIIMGML